MGVLGGLTMALSRPTMAWEVLLVGRLVVGLTAGLNTVLVPVYVSEIAPLHLRGALGRLQHSKLDIANELTPGVFNQLAVTSGIFLGQILGLQVKIFSEIFSNIFNEIFSRMCWATRRAGRGCWPSP